MTDTTSINEQHALVLASTMQVLRKASLEDLIRETGLTKSQVRSGLQYHRLYTGPILGVSIVWHAADNRYLFVDELGNVTRPESIAGYEANYWKRITTESMSAVQQSYTAHQRAIIDDDKLAVSVYKKRQRSFIHALETFSAEAEMVGASTEHVRIEAFIGAIERL